MNFKNKKYSEEEQEDQSGSESVSGSSPAATSDDDVDKMIEDITGNKPDHTKPFSLAEEIEKDEKALHDIPPDEAKVKKKDR